MKTIRFSRRLSRPRRSRGFTLVELLVVIGIVAILASLFLPALARGKEQSKFAVCLSNLRQIGVAVELFMSDHGQRYPDGLAGKMVAREFWVDMTEEEAVREMEGRALFPYIGASEVSRCPEDKGLDFSPEGPNFGPTLYDALGSSYRFNGQPWRETRYVPVGRAMLDPAVGSRAWSCGIQGLSGRAVGWVPDPSRYIMAYEPPARPHDQIFWNSGETCFYPVENPFFFQWHYARGNATVRDLDAAPGARFISPILFVDGHAAKHDFTQTLLNERRHQTEETADWIWYKPTDELSEAIPMDVAADELTSF